MFERYTQNARRLIFFARFEASQHGSFFIDTEHILLGLLREDKAMMHRLVGPIDLEKRIRSEIEKTSPRRDTPPRSVEVPLSADSIKILNLAVREADKLRHRYIGTEHILLGILRLEDCLAARLLSLMGAKAEVIRDKIAKSAPAEILIDKPARSGVLALGGFLSALQDGSGRLEDFFDEHGQFIDSSGDRWIGREEISSRDRSPFALYAKKNARFILEDTLGNPPAALVASVLWDLNTTVADPAKPMLRMSIVLVPSSEGWLIVLAQVTPVLSAETFRYR
jgi:hypothetical protein